MKRSHVRRRCFWSVLVLLIVLAGGADATQANETKAPTLPTVKISCATKLSGGEGSECKVGVVEGHENEIRINVVSNNPSLVVVDVNQVTLAPKQLVAKVNLKSFATPIKTTVNIKAMLTDDNLIQAQESIEVVPALIASVGLTSPSIVGTHGAKTICQVRLRAPAPTGGIEIYLSPLAVSPTVGQSATLIVDNPRVLAGINTVEFDISYDKIQLNGDAATVGASASNFDAQARTIELVVALDPPSGKRWDAIPGLANKVTFQVIPLRVSSLTVQPSTLVGGTEGLVNLTLSAPPGVSETAILRPVRDGVRKLWITPLGSSCAASINAQFVQLPFVAGTSTYSFKVCSSPVTAAATGKIQVVLRSGLFEAPVTVQP